ncbi:MAG TPA: hypothetical protein V6D12_01590 [Candidatus Obscuribacterales bacterium]
MPQKVVSTVRSRQVKDRTASFHLLPDAIAPNWDQVEPLRVRSVVLWRIAFLNVKTFFLSRKDSFTNK